MKPSSSLSRSWLLLVTAALVLTLAPALPASAQPERLEPESGLVITGSATDGDDTFGRLDIGRVTDRTVEIGRDRYLITYRVQILTPFATSRLDVDDRNLVLELNRDGRAGSERSVRISSDAGVVVAEVISNASRQVIARVGVTRPNDQVFQISGPRRILGARSYFWTSNFHATHSARCNETAGILIICQDSVPDRGWLRLDEPSWPEAS